MKTFTLILTLCCLCIFGASAQENTELFTPTGLIYGSLQIPEAAKPMPVVLIISGSGPTDRDGNNTQMKNNSLKQLADTLQAHGFASVRYDKRGIAESADAGLSEEDLRFDNYVDDAAAWILKLKKDGRFSKVIVAGHSEGSLIGMIAANKSKADGFISIAGAGRSADLILKEQLASQPEAIKTASYTSIDSLKNGHLVKEVNPLLYALFRPSVQPYMISWFKYDPQLEIAKLQIPIQIIQGTTDLQVTMEDASNLNKNAPGSIFSEIPQMNHVLKTAPESRQENLMTYYDPKIPLNPDFCLAITTFLNQFR
ncbi:MAG: alpha/beta hydrolase [Bacteroidales bacterium]|nr:alpha/beta hydrolase [Bacteroidales bacterium]